MCSAWLCALLLSCAADDDFQTNSTGRLSFSTDTVKADTVFANVGSRTYGFWVFNRSGSGLRLSSVKLRQGNQTGFRVNVDGSYLDNSLGSVATDLEVRKGDSIRVFVELTPQPTFRLEPQKVEDDLVFSLESGAEQRVHLQAYAWDATRLDGLHVSNDTLIESARPVVLYGEGLRVDSGAVLTVRNTTLYFHEGAALTVGGSLLTENTVLRGDRLDGLFDYLPYDRVSGQWQGVVFTASSAGNSLVDTEIRNAVNGVVLDAPLALDSTRQRLTMVRCVVHNSKGYGVVAHGSNVGLYYCQLTNSLADCMALYGGICELAHCTLAQFYPFSADRGAALRFADHWGETVAYPLCRLHCSYCVVTGYEADVVMAERKETGETAEFTYRFEDCLLRTPAVEDDTLSFRNVLWESPEDSVQGKEHFKVIDEQNLYYDFHLDSLSTAKGLGCY